MKRIISVIIIVIISAAGCKKSKKNPDGVPVTSAPSEAVLIAPSNNAPCNEGQPVSATISKIQFSWNAATNADSYEVIIKDLLTNEITTHTTLSPQLQVNLARSVPYSWHVISKSSKTTATSKSSIWKFYTSGVATSFYAPFPADQLSPAKGASIVASNGRISLSWVGEDADGSNDITGYDVYLGTNSSNLPKIKENSISSSVNDITVSSGSTYFWKVITKDSRGNTSTTQVSSFTVN